MKNEFTYDPEDLESLMMHKSFDELYPEEKSFVLKHMDSSEEYESMRSTLFAIRASKSDNEELTMPTSRKEDVMAAFRAEHQRERWFSLNGIFMWFFPPNRSWIQKPAFQLAVLAVGVVGGVIIFNNSNSFETNQLAELETKKNTETPVEENLPKVVQEKNQAPKEVTTPEPSEEEQIKTERSDVPNETQLKKSTPVTEKIEEFDFEEDLEVASKEKDLFKDFDDNGRLRDFNAEEISTPQADYTAPSESFDLTSSDVTLNSYSNTESLTLSPASSASSPKISSSEAFVAVNAERTAEMSPTNSEDLGNVFTLLEAAY